MKHTRCLPPAACCLLVAVLLQLPVAAQCTGDSCRPAAVPHAAVVRVVNAVAGGSRCYGSGTLVHKDDKRGIVLTCAHLFRREVGDVAVTFPDGRRLGAGVLAVDRAWDLAALKIASPSATPVTIAADHPQPGEQLQSCGYGSDGRYWCNRGRALGYARTAATTTYETLRLSGYARDGDSGGPVFNQRGELVAVLWGTDGRTVEGTFCGRIRKFLAHIFSLGRLPRQQPGPAPLPPGPLPPGPLPPVQTPPPGSDDHLDKIRQRLDGLAGQLDSANRQRDGRERSWGQRVEKIETALALLAGLKGRIETAEAAVGEDNLRAVVRQVATGIAVDRAPGLAQTVLPAVLAALGWTGPPSIAALFAIRLIAGVLRRRAQRRRRRVPGDLARRPKRPKQLNDDYAEQLARVYALSGHSPIADATLGREYDEELRRAEQSSDTVLARWARSLRDRVAKRFYRIHGESPSPSQPSESELRAES